MIKYDKMWDKMKEMGITTYTIKRDKIIGQATYMNIRNNGHIDTRTINTMCKVLHCQPGDILEYVEDDISEDKAD